LPTFGFTADVAEARPALVEALVRQRQQGVGHLDVPVRQRRRRGELVNRREHRRGLVQHRSNPVERHRQAEQFGGLLRVREE
jgi:hypothetical protein